jgi:hypothetical protein
MQATQIFTDQVTTQIELPLYRGSRRPSDLVTAKNIFGHLFESFENTSQATGTGATAGDDIQPSKRTRAPSMKSTLVPR